MQAFCQQERLLWSIGEGKVVADLGQQRKRARVLVDKLCSFCKKGALFCDRETLFFEREALFGDRETLFGDRKVLALLLTY